MELGVSYFGNRILKHFKQDLQEIKDFKCTYVIHTFSEVDRLFSKQAVADLISATKDAGLKVWVDPWGVGRVFGGEALSHFTGANPEALQLDNTGRQTHAACPNAPEFRAFMVKWIEDAIEIGAETIFWDEPHFYISTWLGSRPNTWGCTCQNCRKRWEEETNGSPFPDSLTPEFLEHREGWLVEFLGFLAAETAKRGAKNSVCMLPPSPHHPNVPENWEKVASLESVQGIGTDPYWLMHSDEEHSIESYVRPVSEKLMRIAKQSGKEPHLWLQGFKVPAGREPELQEVTRLFAELGCGNIAVWGFDSCRHVSWIRPDNPDLAWQTVKDAFIELAD